ncbi:MAG: TetR/AcrR family transcriptional regulator [Deltaproteobacteria bacterium]|nr:MAG: TetR/AcrR family transcriptional regulator [Deltaproteobacteria bacterium]
MTNATKKQARKNEILRSAERIFAKKGFQDATISEIAKKAKISEASIYEYFSTKEGLLFSVSTKYASELFNLLDFHLKLIRGAGNKLRSIIYLFLSSYEEHPDNAAIIMLILKHNKKFLNTEGHLEIKKALRIINKTIDEGVETGEFRDDINVYLIRSIIIGTMEHLVTNWLMTERPENLTDLVDPFVDNILEGIQSKEKTDNQSGIIKIQLYENNKDD